MKKQEEWPNTCVSCGREKTGMNACKCVPPVHAAKVHAVIEPEFLEALGTKPWWCACDYPATPHRAGCGPKNRVERVPAELRDELAHDLRELWGING